MEFFNLDSGKKVLDAFKAGHYLDSWQAAIDLQVSALATARKFDGFFGIKLNTPQDGVVEDQSQDTRILMTEEHEAILGRLQSLTASISVGAATDNAKLNPADILMIIQSVVSILELIKKWREGKKS